MTDFYSSAWRRTVALLALALPSLAGAQCSRDIQVPVSAIGASVVVNGARISGIYPDLLRSMGAKLGCNFIFPPVPRARLEAMFEAGKADLLIPASSTPRRDQHGLFIPMLGSRPLLISLQGARASINTMQELIERRGEESVTLEWVGEQLKNFVDAHPESLASLANVARVIDARGKLIPAEWRAAGWQFRGLGRAAA